MTNRVKNDLAGRINQYAAYRHNVQKTGRSFDQALSSKSVDGRSSGVTARPVHAKRGAAPRAGRSHAGRPGGGAKHITQLQAQRLAKYAPIIQQAAQKYNVPVELVCGVILQESGGNYRAVSHCGARGLMQLMPATARRLGVTNSFDPVQNIMGGTKYLRMLLDRFDGNLALAVAGYNAGEGNVEKYGRKIPPFKETRAYVPNVLKYADTLWGILRSDSPVMRVDAQQPAIHHRTIYSMSKKA